LEGLLRDAKPVREIFKNLFALSFACEGGQ
jgi:hypothetical protein